MSRLNIEGSKIASSIMGPDMRKAVDKRTLAGTVTLAANNPQLMFFDPGGAARTVNLPPEKEGLMMVLVNTADALEVITVKDDTSTTTIVTLTQNETAFLFCDGTTWYGVVGVA